MTVGEGQGITVSNAESIVAEDREELDCIFTFEHQEADAFMTVIPKKFSLKKWKTIFSSWQALPDNCWNSLFIENHDYPRSLPRYGKLEYRKYVAKMLAICINFMKGTPYIYQGQEIGMTNIAGFKPKDYVDIVSKNIYKIAKFFPPLIPVVVWALQKRARDHARTPMQWNAEKNAGFTSGTPWMMVNPNYKKINVEEALADEDSILNFYKKINKFRLGNKIIKEGSYTEILHDNKKLFVYKRELGDKIYLVVCSYSSKCATFKVPEEFKDLKSSLVISNYQSTPAVLQNTKILPYEAFVYELTK